MEISVIRAGMMTTVQDLGRRGHLAQGVPWGGAADPVALRVSNLLAGNAEDAPALEITLTGPELEFSGAAIQQAAAFYFRKIEDDLPDSPFFHYVL